MIIESITSMERINIMIENKTRDCQIRQNNREIYITCDRKLLKKKIGVSVRLSRFPV